MNNYTNILKIIEGCLLGDGHLELHENGKNASFRYGSSLKEHTEFIHNYFINYCTENFRKIKRREHFDKRTNKTYVNYTFNTKALPIFTEQYNRFYPNKIKIVPPDIKIDKTLLLMWYIGDGELDNKNGYIKLHTNSFTYNDVLFLSKKLSLFKAKPRRKTRNQYIISIPRTNVKNFLNYIGKCPISDYNYKWLEVPYINKNIELNGINYYSGIYSEIENDYLSGKYSIYKLYKKYNVPINCIKNYFNKNNIKWKPIIQSKKIIQYDLNNNKIFEWNSGQEIKKTLNYNASAISECCRGIRKSYKNYKWKFK